MAEKTLREFSPPSTENIRVGPIFDLAEYDYEIKPSLIKMVQLIIFSRKKDEDAIAHLQNFLEIGNTKDIRGIPQDVVLLRWFPFSLEGRAKQWFYQSKDQFKTWRGCSKDFLEKFLPIGRMNILRGKILEFQQQQKGEPILEAWEHF